MYLILLAFICLNIQANEPIIVYGNLATKSEYSDTNSLSIITNQMLKDGQIIHLEELFKNVPNLSSASGSSRAKFFQIRGIGERSSYEGMPNHSVGVVIDNIDYSNVASLSNLETVSQIEVFKGPQATRLGPSALAGMINIQSHSPTQKFQGSTSLTYANYNTLEEVINLSFPITSKIASSISISKRDSDGYIKNDYLNQKDTNGYNELGIKAKVTSSIARASITGVVHFFDIQNGYDAFSHNNSSTTYSDRPGDDNQQTFSQALTIRLPLIKQWQAFSILTSSKTTSLYSYDEDWGNNPHWNSLPGWNKNYDYNIEYPKLKRNFSFDQRLINNKLILGLYYKNSLEYFRETGYKNNLIRKNTLGNFETNNIAVYFENETSIKNGLNMSYGVRIERRDAKYKDSLQNNFSPSEEMFGGNISINDSSTKDEIKYLKFSKGYKAGGFNTQENVPNNRKEYENENLYSFEVGHKKFWKNINLDTKYSVFFMYRDNIQVKTSFQDDPMDPSSYTFYNDNATDGYNYGLEFELDWTLTSKFELSTSLGLLQTRYGNYNYASKNLKGREMPHSPEYQFQTSLNYHFLPSYYLNTSIFMSDNFFFSNSHNEKSSSYQTVDIKIGKQIDTFDFSVWSKNIFNEYYSHRGFFFSNMPPTWKEERYTQRASPRQFGMTLKYSF